MTLKKALVTVALAAAAMWFASCAQAADNFEQGKKYGDGAPDAAKVGWNLGMQAWTFNSMTLFDALDRNAALGLKVIEAIPGQKISKEITEGFGPGMKEETVKALKDKLAATGVRIVSFGVTGVPTDEKGARKFFEWAKMIGLENIVTETDSKVFDPLCDEFKINIAFHNHPQSWPPEQVLKACDDRTKRIGSCSDTGHWQRRKLVPLDCIKQLKGRIECFHFKDLNDKDQDVPWGTGKCDVKGMLKELYAQGFKGDFSIEYENKYTMEDLAQCVKYFNDCAKEIAAEAAPAAK
jgi:sugar phosphate isomerase/epimerase